MQISTLKEKWCCHIMIPAVCPETFTIPTAVSFLPLKFSTPPAPIGQWTWRPARHRRFGPDKRPRWSPECCGPSVTTSPPLEGGASDDSRCHRLDDSRIVRSPPTGGWKNPVDCRLQIRHWLTSSGHLVPIFFHRGAFDPSQGSASSFAPLGPSQPPSCPWSSNWCLKRPTFVEESCTTAWCLH